MTEFMRPTVTTEEVNDTVARFIVEPLERGYGYTLGNCMRRVLLSSLDGAKATAIQIEGVQHEFTTAEGVIEDITDIVLNVKGLVFSALNDDIEEATAHVSAEGPCTVTGADLDIPTEFTLVNPEHVIATVADGGQLDMTTRCSRRFAAARSTSPTPAWVSAPTTTSSCWKLRLTAASRPPRPCAARPTSSTSTWARF